MMQQKNQPVISEIKLRAIHKLWVEKTTKAQPLREVFQEILKTNPRALRTYEHERLEADIILLQDKLKGAFVTDLDKQIEESTTNEAVDESKKADQA
jgi:hypothetical protein